MRLMGCGNPNHKGVHETYVLDDEKSPTLLELDVSAIDKSLLKPGSQMRIRGSYRRNPASLLGRNVFKVAAASIEGAPEINDPAPPESEPAEGEPPTANAPVVTDLNSLVIFAHTLDETIPASRITQTLARLFTDPTGNVRDYFLKATYGHYSMSLGDSTEVNINLNSTAPYSDLEAAALSAALAKGYDRNDYDRTLVIVPNDHGYAYAGLPGKLSVYPANLGGGTLDIYVHELGHNFGFHHSGVGADQYADQTSAMGGMHWGPDSEVYNASKLYQIGWLSAFPGSSQLLTQDATFYIHPVHVSPAITPGLRAVRISGSDYYFSYLRNSRPYGWLENASHHDKVVLHQKQDGRKVSWLKAVMGVGETDSTSGSPVTFELHGPNKDYAIVSFDLDDGNAKPIAQAQTLDIRSGQPVEITVSGSDEDGETLNYTNETDPLHGVLSGSGPVFTYTSEDGYVGTDSFVFRVSDAKISSFATVTINVLDNLPPVADAGPDQVLADVNGNGSESVTLDGSNSFDPDGAGIASYVWKDGNTQVATGANPTVTLPVGVNVITLIVTDADGATGTDTVIVEISNSPPVANAGSDRSVDFSLAETVVGAGQPGLWFGEVPGNIDTTTPNPQTQVLVDVSSKTEDSIASNTTEIFTGYIFDEDGQISFTEYIDDRARIWIDGNLVINNDAWNARSSTANLNLSPGWHAIEIRISNGSGGSGPVNGEIGIGYDPNGGTAWQTLSDPGNRSLLCTELGTGLGIHLDGSASDPDGDALLAAWSLVSGPSSVTMSDPSALDTEVIFVEEGVYTFRLTVDDLVDQSFDEVVITVGSFSSNTLSVTGGSGDGDYLPGAEVSIVADAPAAGYRFAGWATSDGGFFADAAAASTTYSMPNNDVVITATYGPNTLPVVNAGPDQTIYLIQGEAISPGWSYAPWTGDADSGISSDDTYTVAHCFGNNNGGTVTVNEVAFTEAFANTGAGWTISGSRKDWNGNDDANIGGNSEKLAQEFIYDGNPRTVTLSGLTPGQSYEVNFYSSAWETGDRSQTFSATGTGISDAEINQDQYNNNNGIRISCVYTASATTQQFVITPVSGSSVGTFHLYALSNREVSLQTATLELNGTATDEDDDALTALWSIESGPSGGSISDPSALTTAATFTQEGTYVLSLAVNDGSETAADEMTVVVNPPLPANYATWSEGSFANPFTDIALTSNPDGDPMSNLMEFAFGTDPTRSSGTPLSFVMGGEVSQNGSPLLMNFAAEGEAPDYRAVFLRRKDHVAAGLVYSVDFSADLSQWTTSEDIPTRLTDPEGVGEMEAVSVPYPASVPANEGAENLPPHFFRVGVEMP